MPVESSGSATLSTARTVRPFRWGFFQGLMCIPGAFITGITAYALHGPWRIVNSITTLVYCVTFFGFMDKRRYGFVGYYVLVAMGCFNFARIAGTVLFRQHFRFKNLTPTVFLIFTLAIALFWIVPAIFYYPKRWNEFR